MTPFHLKIVTPDGMIFDGQAEELIVRTVGGDVAILARHIDYVAPSVSGGEVTLVPTTFEWADKIDVDRAEASYQRADKILHDQNASGTELKLAEARLHRALVRKSVASKQ